jgi:hypothetical protein
MQPSRLALALALSLFARVSVAQPRDTWTRVRPGVDYLFRTTTTGPQEIFAARIDLRTVGVGLHASADNPRERAVTTSTFARNVGALVAINADWSDGRTPVGIAVSDGVLWHGHIPNDRLGGRWGFFGCTIDKRCEIGNAPPLDTDATLANPTAPPLRFFEAVGANGIVLISNGAPRPGCYDTARNPRSAIGYTEDRNTLWMVVVDGRRSSAVGMTCDETRTLMAGLGCYEAAMLDGGGSSTLVVDGMVRNRPSDGSPRTVANHLGVMYVTATDMRCAVASGRSCSGSRITTCHGGRFISSGDCAAFGAACEANGSNAYCVDPRCPGGRGNATGCNAMGQLATCVDGALRATSCPAGQACGSDAMGARCMDARCASRPNARFCTPGGLLATCAGGAYTEGACAGSNRCVTDATGSACADPRCPMLDGRRCEGGNHLVCARGALTLTPCTNGSTCDPARGCVAPAMMDAATAPDAAPDAAPPIDQPQSDGNGEDVKGKDADGEDADGEDAPDVVPAKDADGDATGDDAALDSNDALRSGCGCGVPGAARPRSALLAVAALSLASVLRSRRRRGVMGTAGGAHGSE